MGRIVVVRLRVMVMVTVGVAGYVMRVYDFPIAPVLIGLILGPMAENQLRTALASRQGSLSVLVETPISITFLVLAAGFLTVPTLVKWWTTFRAARQARSRQG